MLFRSKLWEKTELENLCSKNPLAVIRLHAKALSPQGKVEVAKSKLWDYASFSDEPTLRSIWKERERISLDERALFALVASEIANGDIGVHSWALYVDHDIIISSLANGLVNFLYLAFRANEMGVRQEPLIRAISYLIVVAIHKIGKVDVASLISNVWDSVEGSSYPDKVREIILEPVLGTLQAELKDVCSRDCQRIMTDPELLHDDEIENYWDRLNPKAAEETESKEILTIESYEKPCKVGFVVSKEKGCPLCHIDNPVLAVDSFMEVVDTIIQYRGTEDKGA